MKKPLKISVSTTPQAAELHKQAEKKLRKQPGDHMPVSPEDAERLLHELEVHQIELEMQNDELRRVQAELEASLVHYFDLYDLAPVGYLTISEKGLILQSNLRAAALLGMDRSNLRGQPLSRFCIPEDADRYYLIIKKLFATGEVHKSELRMKTKNGALFWAQVDATTVQDTDDKTVGRIILSDITGRRESEEALRASELRFRSLAEEMPHFVWEANSDGIPLYANKRFYEYSGLSPEQALAGGWLAIQHPEDIPRVEAAWHQAVAFCAEYDLESRFREDATGAYRWFRIKGSPVRDAAGLIFRWVGTATDVHEQKQAEEALKMSEKLYRAIGESIDYGVWVCEPDGRNIYASESFLKLVGLTQEQCSNFGWGDVLHPDETERTIAAWKECARTGREWDVEHRFRGVDGQWHPVLARGVPVRDEQGNIECWAGINLDISNIKQAAEALKESEERFRTMANAMPQLAWIAQSDGYISWYNERWYHYTGTTPVQMEGWGWQSVHDPKALPEVLKVWKHSIATGEPFDMEFPLRGADGIFRPFLTRGYPLKDKTGRVEQWCGTNTDITERKAIEKAQLFLLDCGTKEGEDFFESLASYLAENLGMDFVCIDKLTGDRLSAQTLVMYCDGKFEDNIEYTLKDTPCGDVVENQLCSFPKDVRLLFPKDAALQELFAESYVGTTLWSMRGEPIGLIAVIGRKPLPDTTFAETILKLVGIRAAGELEHRAAEEKMVKTNKVYKALSLSGQAVITARNETELLCEAVRIVHEVCGYSLVWVGFAEQDAAKTVRIAAQAGNAKEYLSAIRVTWDDGELGRGPTGTAIRTREPVININSRTTPSIEPWRERQLQCGFLSSAAFPLLAGEEVLGALTVYAPTADAFTNEEIQLLMELSSNLAYGIIFMRTEILRQQAEELLRSTAQFPEENPSPVLRVTDDGILLYANQASDDLLDFWQCSVGEPVPVEVKDVLQVALHKGSTQALEISTRSSLKLLFEITPLAEHRYCNLYGRDITAIRQVEASLRVTNARLDILAETGSQLLKSETPQLIVNTLCHRVMAFLDCQAFFNFLVDEARGQLHLNACAGIPQEEAAKIEWLDYGIAVCGCAARDGCRIVAEDILNTPDIRTELVKSYGIQAYACHPLLSQGEVIGTLSFGTLTRAHFTDDELSLMKAVADQVAIAIERNQSQMLISQLNLNLQRNVQELKDEVQRRTLAEDVLLQYSGDLARSNEELDSFSAAVSHDLQEPLRSIAGFIRLLDKQYGNLLDSRGREYIERSVASSKRLGGMINSLLAYSRITTRGKGFEHHELDDVLKTAIENLHASISQTKALITREPLPLIYGDRDQLVRVFQNLIGNSIKYCESSPPEIHVSWRRSPDACIIAVTDNGPGIEPESLQSIFDVFTRCSSNRKVSGAGMGLALCKKIIERHRGKIWAESVQGKGSAFFFSLPLR